MITEESVCTELDKTHIALWLTRLAKSKVQADERVHPDTDFTFDRIEATKVLMKHLVELTDAQISDAEAFKILARISYMSMIYMQAIVIDEQRGAHGQEPE